jgi:hypothetical protein
MKKSTSVLAGLAIAASAILVSAPAANAATPTATVSPAKNIKNGASVTVSASGFKANAALAAVQCKTSKPAAGGVGCNIANVAMFNANKSGKGSTKLKVLKNQGNYIFVGTVDQTTSSKGVNIAIK